MATTQLENRARLVTPQNNRRNEIIAIALLACGVLLTLCLISAARYPNDPSWNSAGQPETHNLTGMIGANVAASVEASVSYVGDRKGRFFTNCVGAVCTGFPQTEFPSYTQLDLRAATTFDTWTVSAFVNNATDQRGVLRSGRDASLSLLYAVSYTQPRTIGLSLAKTF